MSNQAVADRALAAYLGFACGDALGATVEFMSPKQIQQRYGIHRDIIGGGWLRLQPGQVTDDTHMSLALGRAILDHPQWNLNAVADNFLSWFNGQPPDVGNTCRRGILRYRDTGALQGPPRADDAGNGACMRNLPVALATLQQPDKLARWSLEQSRITHHHPLSDAATLALGRMTQALILGADEHECWREANRLISEFEEFNFTPYPGRSGGYVVDTLQTVLHYFFSTDDFESCVVATVNQGGDADTTGALAAMLAGAKYGMQQIPPRWLQALEANVKAEISTQTEKLLAILPT